MLSQLMTDEIHSEIDKIKHHMLFPLEHFSSHLKATEHAHC